MTKFVRLSEAPEKLAKNEYVIEAPSFLPEVSLTYGRAPKTHITTSNYVREVAAAIGKKYLTEDFSALTDINTVNFRGLPFASKADMDIIMQKVFVNNCPQIFNAYVDYYIKNRPSNIHIIYFLGDFHHTSAFSENGIDEVKPKELDVYMGRKLKKIIGKPAIKSKDSV